MTWEDALLYKVQRNGTRTFKTSVANVLTVLGNHPDWAGVLAYDAFREAAVKMRTPPWHAHDTAAVADGYEWTDQDTTRCGAWFARNFDVDFGKGLLDEAVETVARRKVVHPVRDWLATLTWDETPRLDRMLVDYFGADDTRYNRGVSARWMLGAVARAYRPGAKVDCTLVLEGKQGMGKSSGLEVLGGEWFSDTTFAIGEKDGLQALRGKWIYELGELDSLTRAELNKVKAFLTSTTDHYRPSYGRRHRDFPRQVVFSASTNEAEYLKDTTGNRRFWPVKCRRMRLDGLREVREQLWAEARVRFEAGEAWHVDTAEFAALCKGEQEDRRHQDPWEGFVQTWLSTMSPTLLGRGFTTAEVLVDCLKFEKNRITRGDEMRAATVLRTLGWEAAKQVQERGERLRRYQAAQTDAEEVEGQVESSSTLETQAKTATPQPPQPYSRAGAPVSSDVPGGAAASSREGEFGWGGWGPGSAGKAGKVFQ